jgi:hypothetical protein
MYPGRLRAALQGVEVRACFLGHGSFSADDLASVAQSRKGRPKHRGWSSRRLLPGFGGGAISCVETAVRQGCRTSMWDTSVSRPRCGMRSVILSGAAGSG